MVQINEAEDVDKVILTGKAIDQYQKLVSRFPENPLVDEAKKQISKLESIKKQFAK